MMTVTRANATGTAAKLRHPRTLAYSPLEDFFAGRTSADQALAAVEERYLSAAKEQGVVK